MIEGLRMKNGLFVILLFFFHLALFAKALNAINQATKTAKKSIMKLKFFASNYFLLEDNF